MKQLLFFALAILIAFSLLVAGCSSCDNLFETEAQATTKMMHKLSGTWAPATIHDQAKANWTYPCWENHFIEIDANQCIWHWGDDNKLKNGDVQCTEVASPCVISKDDEGWGLGFKHSSDGRIFYGLTYQNGTLSLRVRPNYQVKPSISFIAFADYKRTTPGGPKLAPADGAKPKEQTK